MNLQEFNATLDHHSDREDDLSPHHRVSNTLQNMDWNDLTNLIRHMDSGLMTDDMRQILRQQKQFLLSIRHQLKRDKMILRASYKGEYFHAFQLKHFERSISNYIDQMGIYCPVATSQDILHLVETMLDDLYKSKCLNAIQYLSMMPSSSRTKIQSNYLYFVPDFRYDDKDNNVLVRPIMICHQGPTMNITQQLAELLWLMFDRVMHCQKFTQGGADAVQALEVYAQQSRLRPTTLLVTFTMDDLCTVFPHQETLQALEIFLQTYASFDENFQQAEMSIETMLRLVRFVLDNQYFIYNNQLYRQIAGGASGSPLTMPLAYIYLYHWKLRFLSKTIKTKQEIFGRYLDEAFLTWNGSENNLRLIFDMTTHQYHHHHASLRIPIMIGSTVVFHDAQLSHYDGILSTKVYHYPQMDSWTTAWFHIDTLTLRFDATFARKLLIRAARCCSNIDDFKDELSRILQSSNGGSMKQYLEQFFIEFGLPSMSSLGKDDYRQFRRRIIEHQQQKIQWQRQKKLENKNTFIYYYSEELDDIEITKIKQTFDDIYEICCQQWPEWNQMKFKFQPFHFTPLTLNDYLVERQPSLHLLTLPKDHD